MSVLILPPEGGLKGSLPKYLKIGNTYIYIVYFLWIESEIIE